VKTFVVDASVGAKWLLPAAAEPFTAEAELLLDLYSQGQLRILAPDLFWAELGNVLWKAVIRGRINARDAEMAIERALQFEFPSLPAAGLLSSALAIAIAYGRTVYDSLYVAAAVSAHAELVTADEKLANALGTRFPVRWLGGLSSFL
jgi:predicted nucleic acid-binding protein